MFVLIIVFHTEVLNLLSNKTLVLCFCTLIKIIARHSAPEMAYREPEPQARVFFSANEGGSRMTCYNLYQSTKT